MADFNFAFPDIPYMESREMYDYFFMIDRTLREMGKAINTLSNIDPEAIAKLVMPRADGVSIRDVDNVWTVIRAPFASTAAEADHADKADTAINAEHADMADSAVKLSNARTISLTGDATGSTTFDGSTNIAIPTVVVNAGTADKLTTARTITLTGDTTGSAKFDGSTNISIATTTTHSKAADTASKATNADLATRAQVADKLSSERRITLSGAVSGSVGFDGSKDVEIVTALDTVISIAQGGTGATTIGGAIENLKISDVTNMDFARNKKLTPPTSSAGSNFTFQENGWLVARGQTTTNASYIAFIAHPAEIPNLPVPYALFSTREASGKFGGFCPVVKNVEYAVIMDSVTNPQLYFIPYKGVNV